MEYNQQLVILVILAFLLPTIFAIGADKVLFSLSRFRMILLVGLILWPVGFWLWIVEVAPILAWSCFLPPVQLAGFHLMVRVFERRYSRLPVSAAFNFSKNILPDRVFNMLLVAVLVLIPLGIIAYAYPNPALGL